MDSLVARAPTRIDFGGGWTDVPPYSDERGGCVCNVAITRYASVHLWRSPPDAADSVMRGSDTALAQAALRRAKLNGVSLELETDYPVGAGLGGSSAAGVAVSGAVAAWRGSDIDRSVLAEESRRLEVEDLGVPGGRQDHYASAFGGALGLWFGSGTTVRQIALSPETCDALERRCIVAYTGESRISGDTITAVLDAYRARDISVVGALERMKQLAEEMVAALGAGDLDAVASLVGEHWTYQRSLHPAIPTPKIDAILERSLRAGAMGGKALGASGGGCVLVIAPDERVGAVRNAIAPLSELLSIQVDHGGFRVDQPVSAPAAT